MNITTNYRLLDSLQSAGSLFVHDDSGSAFGSFRAVGRTEVLDDPKHPDRRFWTPEIEVRPVWDSSLDGRSHQWELTGVGAFDLDETVHPGNVASCVYEAIPVYGGPEEGGWDWTAYRLVAVWFHRGGIRASDEARKEAERFAAEAVDGDDDYFVLDEAVVGERHTVSGQHYC